MSLNNKEIYINGILVDLHESKNSIRLIYAVNDLAELKDRQAYSTNTFKLPLTAKNLQAFGFPNDASLIQEHPYRKIPAKIVQNGIEIMPNGRAVVINSGSSIEVQISSGLIGFFDKLGDKNIRDLNLSAWDHIWDLDAVADSQTNTEGFVYSVIDYGGLDNDKRKADVSQLRPATFRKTIIETIIAEAGYVAAGSHLTKDKYQKAIIPFTNDKFEHGPAFINANNKVSASARSTVQQQYNWDAHDYVVPFQDDGSTDPGNHWNGAEYTATDIARVQVKVRYDLNVFSVDTDVPSTINIRIQVNKDGNWVTVEETSNSQGPNGNLTTWTDQVVPAQIDLVPGDKIRVCAHTSEFAFGWFLPGATINIEYMPTDVILGQQVQLAATLPDISQKNFFKDFLQNFGLIVIPDNYRKSLLMLNMSDVYSNKAIAEDITLKLIDSTDDVSYSLSGYGINNKGKYKEDAGVTAGAGDGNLNLNNLTLNDNVTLFTSVFAASETIIKMSGLNVTEVKKIQDSTKSTEFKTKTKPRILLDYKQNTLFTFVTGNVEHTVTTISLPKFDGLDYQTLFQENYGDIKKMLYTPLVVKKKIFLSEVDIANLNWSVPVYDKKSGSYYYKNQIEYIQGDVSTISLIKLGDQDTEVITINPIS